MRQFGFFELPTVDIESSYQENNLGKILFDVTLKYQPCKVVEFGVFHGYSTICIAKALQAHGRGHIIACDLWSEYEFNHTTMDIAQHNLERYEVEDFATLWQADYYQWLKHPSKFDMLHVDISNNGDIIEKTLTDLAPQIKAGAVVVFEGGSIERDEIDWMKKFDKRPINPLQNKLGFEILDHHFPSISIVTRL